jgi:hypothetical protein
MVDNGLLSTDYCLILHGLLITDGYKVGRIPRMAVKGFLPRITRMTVNGFLPRITRIGSRVSQTFLHATR